MNTDMKNRWLMEARLARNARRATIGHLFFMSV